MSIAGARHASKYRRAEYSPLGKETVERESVEVLERDFELSPPESRGVLEAELSVCASRVGLFDLFWRLTFGRKSLDFSYDSRAARSFKPLSMLFATLGCSSMFGGDSGGRFHLDGTFGNPVFNCPWSMDSTKQRRCYDIECCLRDRFFLCSGCGR